MLKSLISTVCAILFFSSQISAQNIIPQMCIAQCLNAVPQIDSCYTPRASRDKLTSCVCQYGSLREFTQCIDCLKFVQNPLAIVYNDIRLGCVASQPKIVERGTNVLTLIFQGAPFQTIAFTNPQLTNPMLAYGGVWWNSAQPMFSAMLVIVSMIVVTMV